MQARYRILGTSPTKVVPEQSYWDSLLIVNTGSSWIFLGNDTTVSNTSGFPLGPGSNKLWDEKQGLYAVCNPGEESELAILDNSGAMFDTTNIAGQILAQGLAGQIAHEINVVGVPAIDRPEIIANATVGLDPAVGYGSAVMDVSKFSSLSMRITEINGVAGSCANARAVQLYTYSDATGTLLISTHVFSYMPSTGGLYVSNYGLKGPYIRLGFPPLMAGVNPSTTTILIIGSYRDAGDQPRVYCDNSMATLHAVPALLGEQNIWTTSGAYVVGATWEYPKTYGGPTSFGWNVGALTNQSYMYIYDVYTGGTLWAMSFPVSATTQRGVAELYLPTTAISWNFNNSTANPVLCRFGLTMDGGR
jgi:hypothetical protein